MALGWLGVSRVRGGFCIRCAGLCGAVVSFRLRWYTIVSGRTLRRLKVFMMSSSSCECKFRQMFSFEIKTVLSVLCTPKERVLNNICSIQD